MSVDNASYDTKNDQSDQQRFGKVLTWLLSEKKVKVVIFRFGDDLKYKLVNKTNNQKYVFNINLGNQNIDQMIAQLRASMPIINDDQVEFQQAHTFQSIDDPFKANLIGTVIGQEVHLIWQIYSRAHKSYLYPFEKESLDKSCSRQTLRFFDNLSNHSYGKINSVLSKKNMNISFKGSSSDPVNVDVGLFCLTPMSKPSEIDDKVLVSRLTWAVTIVANGPSIKNGKDKEVHAQIIVEGIDDSGEFFTKVLALTWKGVEVTSVDKGVEKTPVNGEPKYKRRSEIWKVSSTKANRMIEEALLESKLAVDLNPAGEKSWFHFKHKKGSDNCMTWARKMLRIVDINLEDNPFEWIYVTAKSFTQKGDKILPCKSPLTL